MQSSAHMYDLQNKLAASKKENNKLVEQIKSLTIANGKLKHDVSDFKRKNAIVESQIGGFIQKVANRDKTIKNAKKYIIMQRREIKIMSGFIRNCCGALDAEFEH